MTAYADLYDALHRLGWQLHGGPTAAPLAVSSGQRWPRADAVLGLLDELARSATRTYASRPTRAQVAAHWRSAARDVRTATDLLATHYGPLGQPRTPTSPDLSAPSVDPAWREYAALVASTAVMGERLAVAARAAGVTPRRLRGLAWASERITTAAQRLNRAADRRGEPRGEPSPLADLEVANPAIRTDDPLLELTDRLTRLLSAAWIHVSHDAMTVPTLTDLAAAGVLVHVAAHRALTYDQTGDPATLDAIAVHGRAWRQIHADLAQMRSIDPVPGGFGRELHALRRLLPQAEADPRSEHARGVLVDACRSQRRVAEWSTTAVVSLATSGRLYVAGRALTGDDVGDDPDQAVAKLGNRLTAAPNWHIDNILGQLATAGTAPTQLDGAGQRSHPHGPAQRTLA